MEKLTRDAVLAAGRRVGWLCDGPLLFDPGSPEVEKLTRGALWIAGETLIDVLFLDLHEIGTTPRFKRADEIHALFVLEALPVDYLQLVGPNFVKRMIVAASDQFGRLANDWVPPSCPAQEFLTFQLFDYAESIMENFDDKPATWRDDVEVHLLDDGWDEREYPLFGEISGLDALSKSFGSAGTGDPLDDWFVEYWNSGRRLPPYAAGPSGPAGSAL